MEVVWMQPAPVRSPKLNENPSIYMPLWIVAIGNIWFGIDAGWLVSAAKIAAVVLLGAAV